MKKIFISQPMRGRTDEEVTKERNEAIKYLEGIYGEVEILENYFHEGLPKDAHPLKYLGRSIALMADADAVYFCGPDHQARGCMVERLICHLYNVTVIR